MVLVREPPAAFRAAPRPRRPGALGPPGPASCFRPGLRLARVLVRVAAVGRVIGRIPSARVLACVLARILARVPAGDGEVGAVVAARAVAVPLPAVPLLAAAVISVVLGRAVPLAVLVPLAVRRVPVSAALTPRLGGAIALVPVAAFFPVLAALPVLALIAGGLPLADGSGVPVDTCGGDVRGGAHGGAVPLSARIPGVPFSARAAGVPLSARIRGVPLVTRGGRAPPALLAFVALRGTGLAADRACAVAPGLKIVVRVDRVGLPRHRRKTAGRTTRSHVVTL